MHGPVDHLHPALAELGAEYVVNTVAVRPGFPMLLARVPGPDGRDRFLAGLPGNPQSAVVALVSLVAPLLAGLRGRPPPALPRVTLGAAVPGRGDYTHLALVRVDRDRRRGRPVAARRLGDAARAGRRDGFAVIRPGTTRRAGRRACRSYRCRCCRGAAVTVDHGDRRGRRVTDEPLDLAAHEARGRRPRGPARSSRSRAWSATTTTGAAVTLLEYEGHPSAEAVLREVAAEIAADPEVYAVAVSHRIGRAGRSATSRWSPRSARPTGRRRSRPAPGWSTRSKARLPIWKRQVFADGTDEWVNCP